MKRIILYSSLSTIMTFSLMLLFSANVNKELESFAPPISGDVPIGTVVAWAGNRAFLPNNWKVCDGSDLPKINYPTLYQVLTNHWGPDQGVNAALFKLPDLQGVFLRGVNGTRSDQFSDPDKDNRLYDNNGLYSQAPNGNQPGTFQLNDIQPHDHAYADKHILTNGGLGAGNSGGNFTNTNRQTKKSKGKETRPNNAYVHWVIKVE